MGLFSSSARNDVADPTSRGAYELVENRDPTATSSSSHIRLRSIAESDEIQEEEPTPHEKLTLRRVPDNLPWAAFLVAIVELCERFTYYGLSGPFQNYISNKYHDPNGLPGALGLGQGGATALTNLFQFWCYVTPVIGAVVADQVWGKYRTIFWSAVVYLVGVAVLFVTSLPMSIEMGLAMPGLIAAMAIIGLATGGIKSNVSPMIAEQYRNTKLFVRTTKSGERVIVDPAATIQRIYMIFYLCINIGSLSPIATTLMEARLGFWSAYLLCLCMFVVGFGILVSGNDKYVHTPPAGSIIPKAIKVCLIGLRKRDLDAAKPQFQPKGSVDWDGVFVEEVKRALVACKVFLFFPVYWLAYGQMLNNFVSMAGKMELHGIPNDIMQNIDPITIIIFIPFCDKILYPGLRRMGIKFKPITRITFGFMFAAAGILWAAALQKGIYMSGPCYDKPMNCEAGLREDGTYAPNKVNVLWQTPSYILIGMSEIFAAVTGLEYAYTKAPPNMKSFIMSLFLLTNAGGAALGAFISPWAKDPTLVWVYLTLSGVCGDACWIFWLWFRSLNKKEDELNELDQDKEIDP
ncbi:putative peptide transporter ptr2 [Cercospora beticola]|uniref:Putative peptide transporter ptr2 n=1 Tax=Cercospora beticola TaxID=122368 RepID=A0A2G5HT15_CERBT|nr:putative peptide transporter ptr2 [Cercospora beticola]PIA95670.1 putative peptide transporter ptr2 [Cercospora beticola]WPB06829.1 hypothetical protein RHO25_011489 [Cercospora beticola]